MKQRDKFSFIRYANGWEDGKILLKGLQIGEGEVGLSVGGGGDNSFALLLANPEKVFVIDINKTQLHLMRLKMAAMEKLSYGELLRFFGVRESADRLHTFFSLKDRLDEESYRYFDQRRELITRGILHAGKFERYFQLFRNYVCPLYCREERLHQFCNLSSFEEQERFYQRYMNNRRFRAIFKVFFGVKVMGRLGRDKSFYEHLEDSEDVGGEIKKRFEFGISHSENRSNPYLSYILRGNFTKAGLPLYLNKENLSLIRERLSKIELFHGSLLEVPETERFDFFNLSDIFEYVSREDFQKNVEKLEILSASGARLAVWNMQNKRYLPEVGFCLMEEESRALFRENQSYFYRDFSVYRKRER